MKLIKNNVLTKLLGVVALQAAVFIPQAFALPTLQAHLENSVAVDQTLMPASLGDMDTWSRASGPGKPVGLELIGAFENGAQAIDHGYLVLTVPDTQPLTLWFENPMTHVYNAVDFSGYTDGYSNTYKFEQHDGQNANYWLDKYLEDMSGYVFSDNNHEPYGKPGVDVYAIRLDWLYNGLGTFNDMTDAERGYPLENCNADIAGTTACSPVNNKVGEIKNLTVGFEGVDWAHVDLIAQVTDRNGDRSWKINPASHDSTWEIPEPGSLALTLLGLAGLAVRRRQA